TELPDPFVSSVASPPSMALPITILSVADMIKRLSGPMVRDALASSSSASELGADLQTLADSLLGLLPALDGTDDSVDMQVKLWLRELKCVAYDAEDVLDEFQFHMLSGVAPAPARNMATSSAAPSPPSPSDSFETRIRKIRQRLDVIQKERSTFCLGEREGARRAETMPLPRLPGYATVNASRVYGRDGDLKKRFLLVLDDVWCEDSSQWEAFKMPLATCGASRGSMVLVTTRVEFVANTLGSRMIHRLGVLSEANDRFDNLVKRSFFELSHRDQWYDVEDEEEEMFVMHDLTHDMLKTISMDECSVLEEGNTFSISPNARHSSVVCSSIQAFSEFQSMCPKSLRTFLLIDLKDELSKELLGELFLKFQCLRVLDLSFANIKELPDSVGDLKHLRYLGLKGTNITGLPEAVGRLYNLQTLDSQHCELEELPRSLGNLVNLRHLLHQNYDYATTSLSMMPRGIGNLTSLRTLPIFVASKEPGSASLGELKDLNELRGALFIVRLHSAANGAASAREASLKGKKHLEMLLLEWGKGTGTRTRSICRRDEAVLENLEPPTNLKEFRLDYNYRGFRFPKWMGDPSFSSLETVIISGCINCEYLPPLGQLPSLRFLSICEMGRVRSLGSEFLGGGIPRGFPSLMALHFRDMPEWKHWCTESEEEGDFPLLRDITLDDCPKLEAISLHNLTSLRHLTIKNCSELKSLGCLSSCCMAEGLHRDHSTSVLEHLEFRRCPQLEFSSQEQLPSQVRLHIHRCHLLKRWGQAHHNRLAHISELRVTGEELSIHEVALKSRAIGEGLKLEEGLQKLELAWHLGEFDYEDEPEEVLAGLEPHSNIRELVIDGYRGSAFAAWLGDPSFSKLVKIILKNCTECLSLPALGKLPSLKELHISVLPEVQEIGHDFTNGGFPSLEILRLQDMRSWKKWTMTVEGAFPCLRDLIIDRCPRLKGLGTALSRTKSKFRLRLREFDDVFILEQLQKLPKCVTLCISQFPNLRELPGKSLPPNLKELEIEDCSRLKALSHQLPAGICGLVLTACNDRILSSPRSLSSFVSLTYLWICRFPTLKSITFGSLPSLKELCISSCPELVSLTCPSSSSYCASGLSMLPSLRLLSIKDCPMIRFFSPEEQLPSLLQYMHISGCQILAEWCQEHPTELSHLTKLWIDGVLISAHDHDQPTGGQLITNIEEAISNIRNNSTT
ncbi:hypothetical protein Taro_011773, partial [Colocasia esculenta]|nr:hypothetical protein [Colocasia esculenta]